MKSIIEGNYGLWRGIIEGNYGGAKGGNKVVGLRGKGLLSSFAGIKRRRCCLTTSSGVICLVMMRSV